MMAMNPSRIQRPILRPGELGFLGAFFFLLVDPGFGTWLRTVQQITSKYNHD
jgi:hypothetical protein